MSGAWGEGEVGEQVRQGVPPSFLPPSSSSFSLSLSLLSIIPGAEQSLMEMSIKVGRIFKRFCSGSLVFQACLADVDQLIHSSGFTVLGSNCLNHLSLTT